MASVLIPMFPLTILPLPGELVPLHIFEPRYKELLLDVETNDIAFGIFFNHTINHGRIGSLMKLESVIKRYPGGESDIIVRCRDIFSMGTLYRTYKTKMYPGGDVDFWKIDVDGTYADEKVATLFHEFLKHRGIHNPPISQGLYHKASEVNFDIQERYNFLMADQINKERLLAEKLRFLIHVLQQEEKSRDVFHLN
ncbi:MAG: hypothetical protein L0Y35_06295 [Flammeovirgaceae bacterium]|nr:hypothetical protein [Flammeovirgaceae bacterium]